MRLLYVLLIAATTASAASATSVNLRWVGGSASSGSITGLGTSAVTIAPSAVATLTLDIELAIDSAGLSSAFLSLEFDTDLGNELNVVSFQELSWTNMAMTESLSPLTPGLASTQESTGAQIGKLYTFDGTTVGNGPASTTIAFGRVVFTTNHGPVVPDGPDVFSGIFNCPLPNACVDGLFSNALTDNEITDSVGFGTASVNIPEPTTLALLALGLGALGGAASRSDPEEGAGTLS